MNDGGMFGFGRGAFAECGIDGFAKRVSALQCFEEEEVFAGKALVVDGVVVAVNCQIDLLLRWAAGAATANEMNSDSVAGLGAGVVRGIADSKKCIIDGVRSCEETKIGLQSYVRVCVETSDLACCEWFAGFVVECLDMGPLECGHCYGGIGIGLCVLGILFEPGDER